MADPTFSAPVITKDAITGLTKASYTVSGTTEKAEGLGDNEYQARRAAVVEYRARNPLAFLNLPA